VKSIFVGNLDPVTTAASIRTLFQPHGAVEYLEVITDRETGLSRGFAFVEMTDVEADRAIEALNGSIVDGHTINVQQGRPELRWKSATCERRAPRP